MLVGPHLHETIETGEAFAFSATATTIGGSAANGTGIEIMPGDGRMITFFMNTNTASGKTMAVTVEESADNSTFTSIKKISNSSADITFSTTANSTESFIGSIPFAYLASTTRYVRIVFTGDGASAGGAAATFAISGLYQRNDGATDKFFSDTVFASAGVPTN